MRVRVPWQPRGQGLGVVTAVAQFPSLAQERPHAAGVDKSQNQGLKGEMWQKIKASALLTGSRALDRAQVITVETKINSFRFAKWLVSSFRAVRPKKRAVTWIYAKCVSKSHVRNSQRGTVVNESN